MVTQLSSTKVAVKSFILLDKGWIGTPKRSTEEDFPRDTELKHKKFSPLRKHTESCVPRHLQGTPPTQRATAQKSPASNCLQFKWILSFRALCTSQRCSQMGRHMLLVLSFINYKSPDFVTSFPDGSLSFPFCRELKGPSQIHSRCLGKTSARSAEYQSQTHSWWPPF